MIREVIFDLDNTLILTNHHYDTAIIKSLFIMNAYFKNKFPSLERVLELQGEIDSKLRKELGYGDKKGFSNSLVKTYEELCKRLKVQVNPKISDILFEVIGEEPFKIKCYEGQELMEGVEETLNFLQEQNCTMKIYTRGFNYQYEKVQFFDLYKWFNKDNIIVVPRKTPEDFKKHISKLEEACFVTDSKHDVLVGINSGIKTIHIPLPDLHNSTWDNDVDIPNSDLYKKFNNMLEFKENYYSI